MLLRVFTGTKWFLPETNKQKKVAICHSTGDTVKRWFGIYIACIGNISVSTTSFPLIGSFFVFVTCWIHSEPVSMVFGGVSKILKGCVTPGWLYN
jgi:hypothetical protein